MGTRSTYRFIGTGEYQGKRWESPLALVYLQMDGYPDGHPLETAIWLTQGEVVNGIKMSNSGPVFNGAGCLTAQFIKKFKHGAGGLYIESLKSRGHLGENYLYDVIINEDTGDIKMIAYENKTEWKENSRFRAKKLFEGTPEEYIKKYENGTK